MGGDLFTGKVSRRRLRRPSFGAAIAVVAVVALAGIGYAAIPSSSGVFRGCYAKTDGIILGIPHSKGDLRLVNEGEACRSYETLVTWNQTGPQGLPGADGTDGTDGVSGYEMVTSRSAMLPLPIGPSIFYATCPAGKKALGGGWLVQLYSATGFVGAGSAALASQPALGEGNAWAVTINQAATGAATQAVVNVLATCASVG